MFARVNIFGGSGSAIGDGTRIAREKALPALREVEGFAGLLVLEDRDAGRSLGITFWETEEALRASEEAADRMRSETAAEAGDEIVGVDRYEVTLDERGEPR